MLSFILPPIVAVLYNEEQIMFIPEGATKDYEWNNIEILYANDGKTLSIFEDGKEIAMIANRKLVPQIVVTKEFYMGWIDNDVIQQRKIEKVDTNSLFGA